jgi:hypothetical protein
MNSQSKDTYDRQPAQFSRLKHRNRRKRSSVRAALGLSAFLSAFALPPVEEGLGAIVVLDAESGGLFGGDSNFPFFQVDSFYYGPNDSFSPFRDATDPLSTGSKSFYFDSVFNQLSEQTFFPVDPSERFELTSFDVAQFVGAGASPFAEINLVVISDTTGQDVYQQVYIDPATQAQSSIQISSDIVLHHIVLSQPLGLLRQMQFSTTTSNITAFDNITMNVQAVPEPSSCVIMVVVATAGLLRQCRRKPEPTIELTSNSI